MNQFLFSIWIKDPTSCQIFQIFLFLEQIIQCNISRKGIFQISFNRNFQGPVIFQFKKEGPKELLYEPVSVFHLEERSFFLPNISNFFVFGTDNPV